MRIKTTTEKLEELSGLNGKLGIMECLGSMLV